MQRDQLRRREFITLLGGAAAWPLVARAQQRSVPVIGFLGGSSPTERASLLVAFQQGLAQSGYVEGQKYSDRVPLGAGAQALAHGEIYGDQDQ